MDRQHRCVDVCLHCGVNFDEPMPQNPLSQCKPLMRRAITFLLVLAACSSERVQQIGFQQYTVTATGEQAYAQATQTCDKQGRKWTALAIPPGSPAAEFRFECVNSYEIVPAESGADRIRVFTPDIPLKHVTIPANKEKPADTEWVLDTEAADEAAKERATEHCGKTNQTMTVMSRAFDSGSGLGIIFKCSSPQKGP